MHPQPRPGRTAGFSVVELAALMAIGGMLLFVMLARPPKRHGTRHRIHCVNNLKQVGIAFRTFAVDFDGAYPWKVEIRPGGTNFVVVEASYTNRVSADLLGCFQALSNELSTPKILICPQDARSQPRTNTWAHLQAHPEVGHRIPSYFLDLEASEERPESILSGDRNLTLAGARPFRWNEVTERTPVWNPAADPASLLPESITGNKGLGFDASTMHQTGGHLLMGDGSVPPLSNGRLRDAVRVAAEVANPAWLMPVDH